MTALQAIVATVLWLAFVIIVLLFFASATRSHR